MTMKKRPTPLRALLCAALAASLCVASATQAAPPKAKSHARPKPRIPKVQALPPLRPVAPQPPAVAQPGEALLYNGEALPQSGLTLAKWGSGDAQDTTEVALSNSHALKVTTQGLYQGAKVVFNTPAALGAAAGGKTRYLQMTIRFAQTTLKYNPNTFPGRPGGSGSGGSGPGGLGRLPQGQSPGSRYAADAGGGRMHSGVYIGGGSVLLTQGRGRGRGGFGSGGGSGPGGGFNPGGGFGPGGPADGSSAGLPVSALRVVVTLANGAQADILRPLPEPNEADGGVGGAEWINVGIPLSALKFTGSAADAPLKSLTIGGDGYAIFYIGQIKALDDDTPITAFAGDTQSVAAGDRVMLHATGSGGASTLKFSWDFDSSNGIQEDAVGQNISTQYFKGGADKTYTVTLTVSDVDGIKAPVTSTTTIKVAE